MLKKAYLRYKKNKIAMIGTTLLVLMIVAAVIGPFFTQDPYRQDAKSFLGPSSKYLMGTDNLGRDMLSRVFLGVRYSLAIGIAAILLAFVFGLLMGSVAGYYGGFFDIVIMRFADVFLAFPYVLGAIALMVVLGPGLFNVPIAIAVFSWAAFARMYRSSVLETKSKEYVTAAKSLGAGNLRVMFRHILPNAVPALVVFAATDTAYAILGESVLSFVGLGVPAPFPSLGRMLADSLNYMAISPWMMLFPGLFLILAVLSFILIGDGLRDAIDPEM